MDPLVEQEYTFDIYSARYGHFLVDVYTAYPEVLVRKSGSSIKIKLPTEAATLIKLKYGDSLVKKVDQLGLLIKMIQDKQVITYDDEDLFNIKDEWLKDEDDM